MGLLCIDIKSQFGAFNKPFSNTGGLLTYMVPPKTAIVGLLGAIVGYNLPKTLETFKDTKVGIEPLNNIETKTITYNCHYGGRSGRWVNIKQELLVNPQYCLYIETDSSIETKNKQLLQDINKLLQRNGISEKAKDIRTGLELLFKNHISYYSLYMGKNDFPLRYSLRDIQTSKLQSSDMEKYFPTNCVIPADVVSDIRITIKESFRGLKEIERSEPFRFFILSNVPVSQNSNREFIEFKNFLLKDMSRKTDMVVMPKRKDEYSFYINGEGNLIVCF